jgi:hypothetical protein
MQVLTFSVPVTGSVRIEDDGSVVITFDRVRTSIPIKPRPEEETRITLPKGKTVFDVVLETAQRLVKSRHENVFSAADLFHEAEREYRGLKRGSWSAHVIASAPNHSSYRHYTAKRDFFRYLGGGTYSLNERYLDEGDSR